MQKAGFLMMRLKFSVTKPTMWHMSVSMTKTRICLGYAVTAQLICAFLYTYTKSMISHDMILKVFPEGNFGYFSLQSFLPLSIRTFTVRSITITIAVPSTSQLSLFMRKLVFGVSDQVRHKPVCTATEGD